MQKNFKDLDISSQIQRAILDMGFEEATHIQSLAIPRVLEGKDVIGQAQTGTGKTAAFGIPVLEMIDPDDQNLQAIVLCPTRELAIQVAEELRKLSKFMKKINVLPVYGGQPIDRQIKALNKGVQIVIGTPGRLMDHMRRRTLKMDYIKIVVLDEADEMLDMGFRDDIEFVLKDTPVERQTLLFSATMSKEILKLTQEYQKEPEFLKVVHKELTVPEIQQVYFEVKDKMKLDLLARLLDLHDPNLSLIFCNTKRRVDKLVSHLQVRGYLAEGLHGDMTQGRRNKVMSKFRSGKIDILVATDVAARGIDVDDIEVVFNYDVPNDDEYYVHRIGRTGRAGKKGKAFTFVSGKEIYQLRNIQKYTKTKIEQQEIPSLREVQEFKTDMFLKKVENVINTEDIDKQIHIVEKLIEEDYTSIEIAAALIKMVITEEKTEEEFGDTGACQGMVRFFMDIGHKDRIKAKHLVKAISDKTGLSSNVIGEIDIYDKFSFIEIPEGNANTFLKLMKGSKIKGRNINVEPANKKQS